MRASYLVFSGLFLTFLSQLSISQETPAKISPKEIIQKMDQQQRDAIRTSYSQIQLSTCPYQIQNKRPVCKNQPRTKKLESVGKNTGKDFKDSQSLSVVLEPASEKGIGMLTYSYDDNQKDTESWLYLSALGKVKRMVSGNSDDQEPVAFFGSEFSTEDMENGKVDEYNYKLLTQGAYQGQQVWVIESTPNAQRLRKTRYSKTRIWVDKKRWVALKVYTYDKRGALYKKMLFSQFKPVNQTWVAQSIRVFNVQKQRMSSLKQHNLNPGVSVPEGLLTQRSLTDFAFREQRLKRLRSSN